MMKKIFHGDDSVEMWNEINNAKTIAQLKSALYSVGCKCQELESVVESLEKAVDKTKSNKLKFLFTDQQIKWLLIHLRVYKPQSRTLRDRIEEERIIMGIIKVLEL